MLIAVEDLQAAARELEGRHGLASVEGGRHPGFGTANRIVPLGGAYLELVTVADESEAERSPFGSWVALSEPGRPMGWAVRTPALEGVAGRLALPIHAGARTTRSGETLRWRLAGVERAAAEPSFPFFIEWAPETTLPGRAPVRHPAGEVRLAALRLAGDAGGLSDWLGGERLPITADAGTPAVTAIVLEGSAGEIVLGADPV